MIECRVKDKEGFAMFACDNYFSCWNVCCADDCLYDGWVNQCFTNGRYSGFNGKFSGKKNRSKTFPGVAKAMAEQWG